MDLTHLMAAATFVVCLTAGVTLVARLINEVLDDRASRRRRYMAHRTR